MIDDQELIRSSVRDLCKQYPLEYWQEADDARRYPAEFVNALTEAGWLSVLIPESYGGGGLGIEAVRAINAFGIGENFPDRTLVLTLEDGAERARARDTDGSDRIGGRPDDYHRKVEAAFHIIAAEEPERVKLVDASGTPEQVTERLMSALQDLLP